MPRVARLLSVGVWLAGASLVGTPAAGAQALPRLHITALGLHADRPSVVAGESYHVTIHVHVTERRDRLDELQLPSLTNAIDLGDERRRVAAPGGGTDFYEIMTVSSPDAGSASFTPAYIDAIDPATSRAMRYSSQPLTVNVTSGTAPPPPDDAMRTLDHAMRDALIGVGALLACVALFVIAVLRRRAPVSPRTRDEPPPVPPVDPPRATGDPLRHAIAAFRAKPDDVSLDALRAVLFVRAGAVPGATLSDALDALGEREPQLAQAMAIAERVRFGPGADRERATRDLLIALDRLTTVTA